MKTIEDYQVSEWRKIYDSNRKGAKFIANYYKENGVFPSYELIAENKELTREEEEKIKIREYAREYLKEQERIANIQPPQVTENTEEQAAVENSIVEGLVNGNKNVTIEDGTINNVTIPSSVNVYATINGEVEDGATIKSESTKGFTLNNTGDKPVSVSLESDATVAIQGQYEDVYLNGRSLSGSKSEISGTVTIDPDTSGSTSVTAQFKDGAAVVYGQSEQLTVTNSVGNEPSMEVFAPNATVLMNGKYGNVNASVSDDTLILRPSFHAKKLKLTSGSVKYQGLDLNDFVDSAVEGAVSVNPYTVNITNELSTGSLVSNPGVYVWQEDYTKTNGLSFGILANGKYRYDLNGKTVTCGSKSTGCVFLRGSAEINFVGNGTLRNNADSYGIWCSGKDAVVNIYDGNFEAYTHVLYAENGTINVYGGSFKCLGEPELDVNGHAKFLVNCLDKSYTGGTATINIYGGKFYNYNPAVSYSEPNGPVSFVAEGYHVVESSENGVPVFEVVAD